MKRHNLHLPLLSLLLLGLISAGGLAYGGRSSGPHGKHGSAESRMTQALSPTPPSPLSRIRERGRGVAFRPGGGGEGSLQIPLTVREAAGLSRTAEPVSSGIPLPFGAITDTNSLWLAGPDGATPVPAQFTVLSRWNGLADDAAKAIKWVLVDFQADVPASGEATYYLRTGSGQRGDAQGKEEREKGKKERREKGVYHLAGLAGNVVTVTDIGTHVVVDTGPLRFRVRRGPFNLFDGAWLDPSAGSGQALDGDGNAETEVVPPGHTGGMVLTRTDGSIYLSSADAGDTPEVVVEESGPLHAVIRIEGRHTTDSDNGTWVNKDGGRPAFNYLDYTVRIHAYAGQPWVRVFYSIRYPDRFKEGQYNCCGNPVRHEWDGLRLRLPTNLDKGTRGQGDKRKSGKVKKETRKGQVELRRPLLPLRPFSLFAVFPSSPHLVSGSGLTYTIGGEAPVSDEYPDKLSDPAAGTAVVTGTVPAGSSAELYQDSSGVVNWGDSDDGLWGTTFRGYKVYENGTEVASGLQSAGWGSLEGPAWGVSAGTRHFWQNFPKGIELHADGTVDIQLWPERFKINHRFAGGRQKTHEILIRFYTSPEGTRVNSEEFKATQGNSGELKGTQESLSVRFQEFPRVPLSPSEFLRVPLSSSEFPPVTLSPSEFLRVPLSPSEFPRVPLSSSEFPRVPLSSSEFPPVPLSSFGFPLRAAAPNTWYRNTLALGLISVEGDPNDPVFSFAETAADAVVEYAGPSPGTQGDLWYERFKMDLYGWRNWGDSYRGGWKDLRYFGNNEFDFGYDLLLQYLRQADHDLRFFALGESMAHHLYDIDAYHTGEDAIAYSHGVHKHDASGVKDHSYEPNMSHFWLRGLLTYYALTGDRFALEAAEETAIWMDTLIDDNTGELMYHGETRSQAWAALALTELWEFTGKVQYLQWAGDVLRAEVIEEQGLPGATYPCPDLDWKGGKGNLNKTEVAVWQNGYVSEALGRYAVAVRLLGAADQEAEQALFRLLDAIESCGWATPDNGKFVPGNNTKDNVVYGTPYQMLILNRIYSDGNSGVADYTISYPINQVLTNGYAYGALLSPNPADRERYLQMAYDTWIWTMGPQTQPGNQQGYPYYCCPGTPAKNTAYRLRFGQAYLWLKQTLDADSQPPIIENVQVVDVTDKTATIAWTVSGDATGWVEYGLDESYGRTSAYPTALGNQQVTLTNLQPNTTHHFRIVAKDLAGNTAATGDFTFTTEPLDVTSPTFSNVTLSDLTDTSVQVSWGTDEPATTQIEYGTTTAYGETTPLIPTLTLTHTQVISGLLTGTVYHLRLLGQDLNDNAGASTDFTFTTYTPVTITLQEGLDGYAGAADTTLDGYDTQYMSMNFGGRDWLRIWSAGTRRGIVRFDLSGLSPETAGLPLLRAHLELYASENNWPSSGATVRAYRVTRDWVEGDGWYGQASDGATWYEWDYFDNNATPTNDWTSYGGDYDTTGDWGNGPNGIVDEVPAAWPAWMRWDVTELARAWIDGSVSNDGLLLMGTESGNDLRWRSSEHSTVSERPRLVLVFGQGVQPPQCPLTEKFTEHPQGSPFVRGEEWFWGWDPFVLHDDDGKYKVWYTLWANQTLGIAYAESDDGINWLPRGDASPVHVLTPTPGSWDASGMETVSVLKKDGQYMLWYLGYPCSRPEGEYGRHKCIGLATSADGITWEKHPTPVLTPTEAWEQPYSFTEIDPGTGEEITAWDGGVQEPSVLWDEEEQLFKMWYEARSESTLTIEGETVTVRVDQIGYATSEDGIVWDKYAGNPVFRPLIFSSNSGGRSAWEDPKFVGHTNVIRDPQHGYHLFYSTLWAIGHAYSADGLQWRRNPKNPLLPHRNNETEGFVAFAGPSAILEGGTIKLYLMRSKPGARHWGDGGMTLGLATGHCGSTSLTLENDHLRLSFRQQTAGSQTPRQGSGQAWGLALESVSVMAQTSELLAGNPQSQNVHMMSLRAKRSNPLPSIASNGGDCFVTSFLAMTGYSNGQEQVRCPSGRSPQSRDALPSQANLLRQEAVERPARSVVYTFGFDLDDLWAITLRASDATTTTLTPSTASYTLSVVTSTTAFTQTLTAVWQDVTPAGSDTTSETSRQRRQGDKETRGQGDPRHDSGLASRKSPCLPLSLSPCLSRSAVGSGSLVVTATVTLGPNDPHALWTIAVDNQYADQALYYVDFPRLKIQPVGTPTGNRAVIPYLGGRLVNDPIHSSLQALPAEPPFFQYPHMFAPLQLFTYFDTADAHALYLATHDGAGYTKQFDFRSDGQRLHFGVRQFPEYNLTPGNDYVAPYPMALGALAGDWYDAAKLYRAWALQQPWAQRGPIALSDDFSGKLKASDVMGVWRPITDTVKPFVAVAEDMQRWKEFLEIEHVSGLWYGWHGNAFDTGWPEYQPVEPSFSDGVSLTHQLDNYVWPYILPTGWDISTASYTNSNAAAYAMKDEKGNVQTFTTPPGATFAIMDPATSFWQTFVRDWVLELQTNYDVDGIYLDVWSGGGAGFDYDPTHGHPTGGGNYIAQGMRTQGQMIRQAARANDPGFIMMSEHPGELVIDELELENVEYVGPLNPAQWWTLPLFNTVYHDYIMMSTFANTSAGLPGSSENEDALAFAWTVRYVLGNLLAVNGDGAPVLQDPVENTPNFGAYLFLKELVQSYSYARPYVLYGERLRDLPVEVDTRPPPSANGVPFAIVPYGPDQPVIFSSTWRSVTGPSTGPSTGSGGTSGHRGSVGLVFTNWVTTTQTISYTFDPGQYGLHSTLWPVSGPSHLGLYRLDEAGPHLITSFSGPITRTETLPRRSVLVLMVAPCPHPADLTGNGVVDIEDIMIVAANWGLPNPDPRADLNGDGHVDVIDVMWASAAWGAVCPTTPPSVDVQIVGPEEVVFDWTTDRCEDTDIPDVPARAFRDAQGRVQLIASHYVNRRMVGPDLNQLTRDCGVIMSSHFDSDPAQFDDHEWIDSVYTPDGATVFALIHNEYQGHTHPGQCPSGQYTKCWYNTVTLATSTDGGDTYTHAQPPTHLVASIPYPYVPDTGPAGIFSPSNIIYNAADGYYYALLHLESYQAQEWGTCVMRTTNLADPTSWRAWDGTGYNVRFINPYTSAGLSAGLEPNEPPENHVCRPVSRNEIQKMHASLTFNTYLNRFLLVGTAGMYDPGQGKTIWGVYYSLSDDLIHWTPRQLIMEAPTVWSWQPGDPDPTAYPVVLDPDSSTRNFETTGQRVYLYFTRFNYQNGQMTLDRDLIRVPIEFFQ